VAWDESAGLETTKVRRLLLSSPQTFLLGTSEGRLLSFKITVKGAEAAEGLLSSLLQLTS